MEDNFKIKYSWKKVKENANKSLFDLWKDNVNSEPGIYRFVFEQGKNNKKVYIGETKNLNQRLFRNYSKAHKSQSTNVKIYDEVLKADKENTKVSFTILGVQELTINNKKIIENHKDYLNKIKNKSIRCLLENYFIVKTGKIDRKIVLNKE